MQLLPVFAKGERVLAAVSGGADSVCLLRLLCLLRDQGAIVLTAAHLNHGIRGADADADQAFVEELCRALGVPLTCGRADVPALARANRAGLETQARLTRRAFLLDAMAKDGATAIATAHHAQDQAETVLMHLLRGGGLRGAGGMRAREGEFCKPLILTGRDEITAYLEQIGQGYRQDSTNFAPDNPRNALRLQVMPALRAIYPGGEVALGRFARLAAEADDCIARQAQRYLEAYARKQPFGASLKVAGAHPAVLRRALLVLAGIGDFTKADALLSLCLEDRGVVEYGDTRFERAGQSLYMIDTNVSPDGRVVPVKDGASLPELGTLHVSAWQGGPIRDSRFEQAVDARVLRGAVLRTRRTGDKMRPLGAPGTRKLSDVLTDKRIDRPMRDYLPLVARGDTVLWAVGVCLAQEAAITKATAEQVRLVWKREEDTPWTMHRS